MRLKLFSVPAVLVVLLGSTAAGQGSDDDEGFWFMFAGQGPLWGDEQGPSRFRWWLDVQMRFLDDVSGLQQGILRPAVGYVLGKETSVWLGYAYVRTDVDGGPDSNEDRIWQQFTWQPPLGEVRIQSRTRLEQRFLDTGSDTGWRIRQLFKLARALPSAPHLSVVGYDEVFFDLNDTDWGQASGFAQNRFFLGLGIDLEPSRRTTVEVGYLNQFIDGTTVDETNHILSLNFFLNL